MLLRLGAAIGVAIIIFAGYRVWTELREQAAEIRSNPGWWAFLAGHGCAFLGFFWLTALLLEGNTAMAPPAWGWAVAWLSLAIIMGLLWVRAALPGRVCWFVVRRAGAALALAAGVGAAAWGLSLLTYRLWAPLGRTTMQAVRFFLEILVGDVVVVPDEFVVGTSSFEPVEVSPECSGFEGIGLFWGLFAVYLVVCFRQLRFPHVLILLPLGTAAVWLANVVRITLLVCIGHWGWPEVALGGFHSLAGWLGFLAVALGMVALTQLPVFRTDHGPAVPSGGVNPTALYLGPFLAIVAASLVTQAFAAGWDWLYPLRVVAGLIVIGWYGREYIKWDWRPSWRAPVIGGLVFVLWVALHLEASDSERQLVEGLQASPPLVAAIWLAFRVVGHVLVVPFAEELAFRGYLTRRLIAGDFEAVPPGQFSWPGFVVSSVLFGLLHGDVLAGTLAGAGYGLAWYWRGRLADAVWAHATTNALITVLVLAGGWWRLWV
jgi:exosortase E/protease (VPEID-CTERM system)